MNLCKRNALFFYFCVQFISIYWMGVLCIRPVNCLECGGRYALPNQFLAYPHGIISFLFHLFNVRI